jgi:hypothetical protein
MASCSGFSHDKAEAQQLLAQADTLVSTGSFEEALAMLDTLKARYPKEIETQRAAMQMRPLAIQGLTVNQIEETDREQAYLKHVADSLLTYFTKVHDSELGDDYDYYITRECRGRNIFERTGVEGRVSPDGEFYIISSLKDFKIKHTAVSVFSHGIEASTQNVAYDGELNYRSASGSETITFTGAQVDSIGQFLCQCDSNNIDLCFKGVRKVYVPLNSKDRLSLIRGYELSRAMSDGRKADARRRLLEQQLALARDQIARTSTDAKEKE